MFQGLSTVRKIYLGNSQKASSIADFTLNKIDRLNKDPITLKMVSAKPFKDEIEQFSRKKARSECYSEINERLFYKNGEYSNLTTVCNVKILERIEKKIDMGISYQDSNEEKVISIAAP